MIVDSFGRKAGSVDAMNDAGLVVGRLFKPDGTAAAFA
jgi:hypothetical protein